MNEQAYNPNYNQQGNQQFVQPKPDNNLILAIFTTVCCCLPAGIYAIIKANDVNNLYNMGRYQEAISAAAEAKKWSIIGIVCGVVISVLYSIFVLATGILSSM